MRFRIGSDLIIRVYVDAAYGVHIHDGKSHSGAYTVLATRSYIVAYTVIVCGYIYLPPSYSSLLIVVDEFNSY